MSITITHMPQPSERTQYEKLLKKIFPTTPLYIFLAVSTALLILMVVQHIANPSTYSLVFISISLLCIMLGGFILLSTKRVAPTAAAELMDSLGESRRYTFTDTEVTITKENGETLSYARERLIGQYCTDAHYIFCFANRTTLIPVLMPMIIAITPENIDALNDIVRRNNARGINLRKLKIR